LKEFLVGFKSSVYFNALEGNQDTHDNHELPVKLPDHTQIDKFLKEHPSIGAGVKVDIGLFTKKKGIDHPKLKRPDLTKTYLFA
jgi:hypothetical protein